MFLEMPTKQYLIAGIFHIFDRLLLISSHRIPPIIYSAETSWLLKIEFPNKPLGYVHILIAYILLVENSMMIKSKILNSYHEKLKNRKKIREIWLKKRAYQLKAKNHFSSIYTFFHDSIFISWSLMKLW